MSTLTYKRQVRTDWPSQLVRRAAHPQCCTAWIEHIRIRKFLSLVHWWTSSIRAESHLVSTFGAWILLPTTLSPMVGWPWPARISTCWDFVSAYLSIFLCLQSELFSYRRAKSWAQLSFAYLHTSGSENRASDVQTAQSVQIHPHHHRIELWQYSPWNSKWSWSHFLTRSTTRNSKIFFKCTRAFKEFSRPRSRPCLPTNTATASAKSNSGSKTVWVSPVETPRRPRSVSRRSTARKSYRLEFYRKPVGILITCCLINYWVRLTFYRHLECHARRRCSWLVSACIWLHSCHHICQNYQYLWIVPCLDVIMNMISFLQLAGCQLSRIRCFCWWQARWSPPLSSWWFWAPPFIWSENVRSKYYTLDYGFCKCDQQARCWGCSARQGPAAEKVAAEAARIGRTRASAPRNTRRPVCRSLAVPTCTQACSRDSPPNVRRAASINVVDCWTGHDQVGRRTEL